MDLLLDDQGSEISIELSEDEHRNLSGIASEWGVDLGTAASRMVMAELRTRFQIA